MQQSMWQKQNWIKEAVFSISQSSTTWPFANARSELFIYYLKRFLHKIALYTTILNIWYLEVKGKPYVMNNTRESLSVAWKRRVSLPSLWGLGNKEKQRKCWTFFSKVFFFYFRKSPIYLDSANLWLLAKNDPTVILWNKMQAGRLLLHH